MSRYRQLIAEVKTGNRDLKIIDPEPLFCNTTECSGYRDGQFFYRDDNHLTIAGGIYLAPLILDTLFGKATQGP
jgi:hypothetical protein